MLNKTVVVDTSKEGNAANNPAKMIINTPENNENLATKASEKVAKKLTENLDEHDMTQLLCGHAAAK